jgi:hypothetical protein
MNRFAYNVDSSIGKESLKRSRHWTEPCERENKLARFDYNENSFEGLKTVNLNQQLSPSGALRRCLSNDNLVSISIKLFATVTEGETK